MPVVAQAPAKEILHDLRNARRRHYLRQLDWVDALYKAYLTAVGASVATLFLSGALGDAKAGAGSVHAIATRGPAVLGLLVALIAASALRSGARGGPLALQPPDVHQILLAPVDRGVALRGPAIAQLRSRLFVAAVTGAVVGNLAFRRLPGKPGLWVLCGVLFGLLAAGVSMGAALLASGRRLAPAWAAVAGIAVIGWSVADWLAHVTTSPATMLGQLAVAPLEQAVALHVVIGVVVALAVLGAGLAVVGGTSLEASLRRAGLVAQLRFAVTVQDLRTVILLRRQLAAELPRSRPWVRLRPAAGGSPLKAIWRRGWRSYLRWPGARVVRVGALGLVAGASLGGAWRGTTPLVVVAGAALLLAALDAIEPLAQEIDHPIRRSLLPLRAKPLLRPHLAAPAAVMVATALVGTAAAFAVTGDKVAVGAVVALAVPSALRRARGGRGERDHRPVRMGAQPGRAERARGCAVPARDHRSAPDRACPLRRAARPGAGRCGHPGGRGRGRAFRRRDGAPDRLPRTEGHGVSRKRSARPTREAVLVARGLQRTYGDLTALAGLDLTVHAGEMVALVGPNGAGKSTFLGLAGGLLEPSSGTVQVAKAPAGSIEARAATSFLPDLPSLYDDLSLDEHLEYIARLHGAEDWQERAATLLERLGLDHRAGDLPAKFSRGMRQKSSIALAFVRPFSLLLADEPFDGLDPESREAFGGLIDDAVADGAAVIVSTHRADVLQRAHRCISLYDGAISYDGPPDAAELPGLG